MLYFFSLYVQQEKYRISIGIHRKGKIPKPLPSGARLRNTAGASPSAQAHHHIAARQTLPPTLNSRKRGRAAYSYGADDRSPSVALGAAHVLSAAWRAESIEARRRRRRAGCMFIYTRSERVLGQRPRSGRRRRLAAAPGVRATIHARRVAPSEAF